jgi:hypothetical protein
MQTAGQTDRAERTERTEVAALADRAERVRVDGDTTWTSFREFTRSDMAFLQELSMKREVELLTKGKRTRRVNLLHKIIGEFIHAAATRIMRIERMLDDIEDENERNTFLERNMIILGIDLVSYSWDDFSSIWSQFHHNVGMAYHYLSGNPNITWEDIIDYPTDPWSSDSVLTNPNITWQHVLDNPGLAWNYRVLSGNPNITCKIMLDNPDKNWDYNKMCEKPDATYEIIMKYSPHRLMWFLVHNPVVTIEQFEKYTDSEKYEQIKHAYCENPSAPWEYIKDNAPKVNMFVACQNADISLDIIEKNMDLWDFYFLSINPNITFDFVEKNKSRDWSTEHLFDNASINFDECFKLYNLSHEWSYVSDFEYEEPIMSRDMRFSDIFRNPWIPLSEIEVDDLSTIADRLGMDTTGKRSDPSRARYVIKFMESALYYSADHEHDRFRLKIFSFHQLINLCSNMLCNDPYFRSPQYRRRMSKANHNQMYCELLTRACHPSRSVFSWNEGAADEMPDEYTEECARWRKLKNERTEVVVITMDETCTLGR